MVKFIIRVLERLLNITRTLKVLQKLRIQRAGLRLVMLAFLKKIPGTCVLLIGLRTSLKCLMGQCLLPNMLKIN